MTSNLDTLLLRIMQITYSSAVDGEGFRDTLFLNYCPHHCVGCHNPQTWDKENGKNVTLREVYNDLTKSYVTNITYSGGEPFCQAENLTILTRHIKENTSKTIWIYSGYTFEQLINDSVKFELLKLCDVLVDGKFEKEFFKENLRFKGSTNQRIIDIQKSLKENKVILWDDPFRQ